MISNFRKMGVFSGFDAKKQSYDRSTWNYSGTGGAQVKNAGMQLGQGALPPPLPPMPEKVDFDLTLQNPHCVFQLLSKHYSRYTPEMVERVTGIPRDQFLKVADLFTSIRKDGDMKKAGTIIYAVGWTHHSFGTQIIRTAAILQLLMGNVGRAGGGVNALRGHSNIQGATDMAGIFDNLPGYLKVPTPADDNFDAWMKRITPTPAKPGPWQSFNYWSNTPKFAVSFIKSHVRRRRDQADRLGFLLSAQSRSQFLLGATLGQHVQRHRQRHFCLWHERRRHRSGFQEKYRRVEKSRLARRRRDLSKTKPASSGSRRAFLPTK